MKSTVLGVDGSSIRHNARIKTYPDGSMDILVCERSVWGFSGWEAQHKGSRIRDSSEGPEGPSDAPGRALRRAKAQVRELALANPELGLRCPSRWYCKLAGRVECDQCCCFLAGTNVRKGG